jgi:LuxR family maltose regulon positive regulatory protein
VSRPRLIERLNAGPPCKLTLVSAPAGYGKTTLVAEWLSRKAEGGRVKDEPIHPFRAAWLSLDAGDNDPARFLAYWLAALRRVDESIGQSAQSLLGMPQLPPLTAILDGLLNDLAAREDQVVLVLDDYHTITNPQLHDALEYFIEHQPTQVHLAIATREDPPLPLARMRARRQMTEIRAHDLRFTLDEARQFFSQSMQLDLDAETVNMLEARTEGWAAGLQLAALALQNLPDQQDFLADFSGSHRYIIDYLLNEVLKGQPPEIRDFLSKTAVLQRFNAELCQAVTGNPASTAILSGLERANLFLIPLDDVRGWYRYHHLFADVLRAGLSPEAERENRRIAAAWFEREGLFARAIPHWLAVPDATEAARLIRRLAADLLKNGELQTLLGWLEALPEQAINENPDLLSYKALSLLLTGQISQAQDYARRAHQMFESRTETTGLGRVLSMQAWFAMLNGDANSGELAQAALTQLDETDLFFRFITLIALGDNHAWNAKLPAAAQVFREACQLGKQINHTFMTLGALAHLAYNLWELGQLREAEALCRAALEEYVDNRGHQLPILGIIYSPLATICYEKGDFDEAQTFARRGIEQSRRSFSNIILGGDNEIVLARIAFQQGNPKEAFELLQSTATIARQRGVMMVAYKMAIVQVELLLLQGNLAEAELLLKELESQTQSRQPKTEQLVAHLYARYWAASDQPEKALEILGQLEQAACEEGCLRRLIGVHLAQALTFQKQGNRPQATAVFESAIRLAAPEGYMSVFFPHSGRQTRHLLQAARPIAPEFVDDIQKKSQAASASFPPLPDPLTEQELRVLKLVMAGKSNREIADELVISVGTAKWHVHNVLQKLGVNNRPQAIARAHELGIA